MTFIDALKAVTERIKNYIDEKIKVKIDKNLGTENAGKMLSIDENGEIEPCPTVIDLPEGTLESPIYVTTLENGKVYKGNGYFAYDEAHKEQSVMIPYSARIPTFNILVEGPNICMFTGRTLLIFQSNGTTKEVELMSWIEHLDYIGLRYEDTYVLSEISNSSPCIADLIVRKSTDKVDWRTKNEYIKRSLIIPREYNVYDTYTRRDIQSFFVIPWNSQIYTKDIIKPYIATYNKNVDVPISDPLYPWNSVDFLATESEIDEITDLYFPKDQGVDNADKILSIDESGYVVPTDKITKEQLPNLGTENAGKMLSIDENGEVTHKECVNPDWRQTDYREPDYIINKPFGEYRYVFNYSEDTNTCLVNAHGMDDVNLTPIDMFIGGYMLKNGEQWNITDCMYSSSQNVYKIILANGIVYDCAFRLIDSWVFKLDIPYPEDVSFISKQFISKIDKEFLPDHTDNTFTITLTEDESYTEDIWNEYDTRRYQPDKTFDEIKEAIDNEKEISVITKCSYDNDKEYKITSTEYFDDINCLDLYFKDAIQDLDFEFYLKYDYVTRYNHSKHILEQSEDYKYGEVLIATNNNQVITKSIDKILTTRVASVGFYNVSDFIENKMQYNLNTYEYIIYNTNDNFDLIYYYTDNFNNVSITVPLEYPIKLKQLCYEMGNIINIGQITDNAGNQFFNVSIDVYNKKCFYYINHKYLAIKNNLVDINVYPSFDNNDYILNGATYEDIEELYNKGVIPFLIPLEGRFVKMDIYGNFIFERIIEDRGFENEILIVKPNSKCLKISTTPTRITLTSSDTIPTLLPNQFYVFPEMTALSYLLAPIQPEKQDRINEYHFMFTSGTTPTVLTHPEGILHNLTVEPNKKYEVSILENCLSYQCWDLPASVSASEVNESEGA